MAHKQFHPETGRLRDVPTGLTVRVYRDDPTWDRHSAWFLVPHWILNELYVCTYDLAKDPTNPECPADPLRDIEYIEAQHSGCVFIY